MSTLLKEPWLWTVPFSKWMKLENSTNKFEDYIVLRRWMLQRQQDYDRMTWAQFKKSYKPHERG